MINQTFFDIILYSNLAIEILSGLIVFALIIIVGIFTLQKKLEPGCSKNFSILFIIYLVFLLFSMILSYIIWPTNKALIYILLSISMEIYLFHKKSKWKFGILATVLLSISIVLSITSFVLLFILNNSLAIVISQVVVEVVTSFNYMVIGIVILNFLRKTAEENLSLKIYTKPLSIGVVFIFIIQSLFTPIYSITYLISGFGSLTNYEFFIFLLFGTPTIANLFFIIGIIALSIGAIKTMFIPLTFSKDKGVNGYQSKSEERIPTISAIYCRECGVSIPPGVEFCSNCGQKI